MIGRPNPPTCLWPAPPKYENYLYVHQIPVLSLILNLLLNSKKRFLSHPWQTLPSLLPSICLPCQRDSFRVSKYRWLVKLQPAQMMDGQQTLCNSRSRPSLHLDWRRIVWVVTSPITGLQSSGESSVIGWWERGNSGGSDVEDEDAGFGARQLPVRKHEVEETNLERPSPAYREVRKKSTCGNFALMFAGSFVKGTNRRVLSRRYNQLYWYKYLIGES